jgi:transposase
MYVRKTSRKNKDGSKVTYVQLAHNVRDPEKGYPRAEVIYSFGRADRLDVEAIKRLIKSLSRLLSEEDAAKIEAEVSRVGEDIKCVRSMPMGGGYLLRRLWESLGFGGVIEKVIKGRKYRMPVEWAIYAMVANRALAPDSKRAVEEWVRKDVWLGNKDEIELQHLYRGMDILLEAAEELQEEIYYRVANLLNLEVDLIFFDTTSTYMEIEGEDEGGLRRYGHSKDRRPDLPQVVIGLAVTKEGIPVKCWVLPGNTSDMKTVRMVQEELRQWRIGRCIWVMDRGMNSEENRVILQRAGGQYILGEKLRDARGKNKEALCCGGRYRRVRENLMVKEVYVGQGRGRRRFVVVYNPEQAKKDKQMREEVLKRIEETLKEVEGKGDKKALCDLLTDRRMGRYLKKLKNGKVKIDREKVKAEEALDGKYLLTTSDESLSAEEVALGYKQLLEVERAFRTLKSTLELRPVYHRKDERIKAHVLLCFFALVLIRIAEIKTGQSWRHIRAEMQRMHLVEIETKDGRILQRTELTPGQSNILKKLKISPPPKIYKAETRT